ncbi:MAG: hypothetical protein ACI4TU_11375 [Candidatus Cryptobacteroides sp.]
MADCHISKCSPIVKEYASKGINRNIPPMVYLYECAYPDDICEAISKLVFVRIFQSEHIIVPEDDAMMAKARDLNLVRLMADEYVNFVCYVNPHFSESDSYSLLEAVVEYYAVHIDSLIDMFAFDREDWKLGYSGALFIE